MTKQALVFGGTGKIGQTVVTDFTKAGIKTIFTYHKSKDTAQQLCRNCNSTGNDEDNCTAITLDLGDPEAVRKLIYNLAKDGITPDIFVNCAVASQNKQFKDITDDDWDMLQRINCQSIMAACQALSHTMADSGQGEIILLGAINQRQSFNLPLHFAATQGMLTTFTTCASKSLGTLGIRINLIVPGILDGGISSQFDPALHEDFIQFSALGRKGQSNEISQAIMWLATQNTYITGQVIPVNGGL